MSGISGQIPCEQSCAVPDGVTLTPVPLPRHAWSDVIVCPNDGCGLCFLATRAAGSSSETQP